MEVELHRHSHVACHTQKMNASSWCREDLPGAEKNLTCAAGPTFHSEMRCTTVGSSGHIHRLNVPATDFSSGLIAHDALLHLKTQSVGLLLRADGLALGPARVVCSDISGLTYRAALPTSQ